MIAMAKKEFRGFMTSMIGYVFIAFLLVITGIYFTAYHLQGMYSYFAYTLNAITFVFLIAVPILTMRILAEERRQRTDQLLLTSPVSIPGLVIGKYLALLLVYLLPVAIMSLYPLIMMLYGTISIGETYAAVLGFFLLGSTFIAMGVYISSITESQVIAAVLTFLVLFVCYVMEGLESFIPDAAMSAFGGVLRSVMDMFVVTGPFETFCTGIIDLTGVVYYLSLIFVFLFLTVQSIQKRRWN